MSHLPYLNILGLLLGQLSYHGLVMAVLILNKSVRDLLI